MKNKKTAGDYLSDAAKMYDKKNREYGNNYKRFGKIMSEMFPEGLTIKGPDDFNRIGIFFHMVDKLTRYANNFNNGGHEDSVVDESVYSAMLRELDRDIHDKKAPCERSRV